MGALRVQLGLVALIVSACGSQVASSVNESSMSMETLPSAQPEPTVTVSALDAPTGGVEGLVWADLDVDGLIDQSEPTVAGVEIVLTSGEFVATASTSYAASANYEFTDVPAGNATVSAMLDGWTTPATVDVVVVEGAVSRVDFGSDAGSLVGAAWFDDDGDGTRDAGEKPVPGLSLAVLQDGSPYSQVIERSTGPDGSFRLPAARAAYATLDVTWVGDRSLAPVPVGTDSVTLLWLAPGFGDADASAAAYYPRDESGSQRCATVDRRAAQCLLPDIAGAGVAVVRPTYDHRIRASSSLYTAVVGQPFVITAVVEPVGPYVTAVYDVFLTIDDSMKIATTPINICNPGSTEPLGGSPIPCEDLVPFVDPAWMYFPGAPRPPLHLLRGDQWYPVCADPPCEPYDPVLGPNEPLTLTVSPTRPGIFDVVLEVPTTKFGFDDRNPDNNRTVVTIEVISQLPATR